MLRIIFIIKSNLIGGVYMNIATIMLPIMSVVGVAIIVLAVRFIVKNVKK